MYSSGIFCLLKLPASMETIDISNNSLIKVAIIVCAPGKISFALLSDCIREVSKIMRTEVQQVYLMRLYLPVYLRYRFR